MPFIPIFSPLEKGDFILAIIEGESGVPLFSKSS
jgi:hypothetical protein